VAAKLLDVSQTPSSSHWQYPPKNSSPRMPILWPDPSEIVIATQIIPALFQSGTLPKEKGTAEAVP
jgi:hypothetical protein